MKFENLKRLGSIAALLAATLLIASEIVANLPSGLLPFELSGFEFAIFGWGGINVYLGILLTVLLELGLLGLYAPQAKAAGVIGAAGLFVVYLGGRLALNPFFVYPIAKPYAWISRGDPNELWQLLVAYVSIFIIGWVLFGVATFRAGVYPRAAAILLIAGALIILVPVPFSSVIFAAALAWMGYVLFTGRTQQATRRRSRAHENNAERG